MLASAVRSVELPSRETVPVLGQGTWHMAEDPSCLNEEIAALRLGLDLGMTLIDTAETYANGGAELLVGEAIANRRDEVFVVSKVMPQHASFDGTIKACEGSLRRLRTEYIDLYLLHWRGRHPLAETVRALEALTRSGAIRYWGVSNFDVDDMEDLVALPGGAAVQTNQVLYNLSRRGIEYDLLPWSQRRGLPIMAYSPIEQGRLLADPSLREVAARHDATAAQVALAWVLHHDSVIAIPKAATVEHVKHNRAAAELQLTEHDLATLDRAFASPTEPRPLELL
jgi:diketogulonate reductase-like aldo/keto reductase